MAVWDLGYMRGCPECVGWRRAFLLLEMTPPTQRYPQVQPWRLRRNRQFDFRRLRQIQQLRRLLLQLYCGCTASLGAGVKSMLGIEGSGLSLAASVLGDRRSGVQMVPGTSVASIGGVRRKFRRGLRTDRFTVLKRCLNLRQIRLNAIF